MDIWLVPWYNPVLVEANKLWVYAILLSLARNIWRLFIANNQKAVTKTGTPTEEKKNEMLHTATPPSSALWLRVIADFCDLALPGSFLGWIPVTDLGVGICMVTSSIIKIAPATVENAA